MLPRPYVFATILSPPLHLTMLYVCDAGADSGEAARRKKAEKEKAAKKKADEEERMKKGEEARQKKKAVEEEVARKKAEEEEEARRKKKAEEEASSKTIANLTSFVPIVPPTSVLLRRYVSHTMVSTHLL